MIKNSREQLLKDAIQRLRERKPLNAELALKASTNRLKLNFSSVAQEAGVSRTLIGFDNCEYPEIREQIKALMCQRKPLQETIDRLQLDVLSLQSTVALQRQSLFALIGRLKKKNEKSTAEVRSEILKVRLKDDQYNKLEQVDAKTLKERIVGLQCESRMLERKIGKRDTLYAILVIAAREREKGRRPDGTRLQRMSKFERLRAISIVR